MWAIEANLLCKKYGHLTAVKDVSFQIKTGELFGFLGPNGAGKTTTLKMLTTLILPTSGWAKINGFDVRTQKEKVREGLGIIFQESTLDPKLTAQENLTIHGWLYNLDRQSIKLRVDELLKMVQLESRAKDLIRDFSGGMKRRLEIARALIHKPSVLFLDEPTLGLDPQSRTHILDYIKDLKDNLGVTVFMTTHYLDEAESCDRIAVIDQSKIIALDTPSSLKTKLKVASLNEAFLKLTGGALRDEK